MSDRNERLRRLLLIVPFVRRNPGVTVANLAEHLGVAREQLLADLELLTMVGKPPFSPGDYIDIYAEGERCYVALDQRLANPPRLTAAEAAALLAATRALGLVHEELLASLQRRLERALSSRARPALDALTRRIGAGGAQAAARRPEEQRGNLAATVRFSAKVAPWVREEFGEQVVPLAEGGVEVAIECATPEWLTSWIFSFGGEASLTSPAWLRAELAERAEQMLSQQPFPAHEAP